MDQVNAYLLFQGRSGSGLLLSLLRTSPAVRWEDEYLLYRFHGKPGGASSQITLVHQLFADPRPEGVMCVGFVSKLRDVGWPVGMADALEAHDVRVVDLRRRNLAKQVLSTINLDRTKRVTGTSHAWSPSDVASEPVEVDLDRFQRLLDTYQMWVDEQARFAVSRPWPRLRVDYEELVENREVTMARVAEFLEVDPASLDLDPERITLKQTPSDLASIVANFDALRGRYAGTPVADMLDDPGI